MRSMPHFSGAASLVEAFGSSGQRRFTPCFQYCERGRVPLGIPSSEEERRGAGPGAATAPISGSRGGGPGPRGRRFHIQEVEVAGVRPGFPTPRSRLRGDPRAGRNESVIQSPRNVTLGLEGGDAGGTIWVPSV